MSKRFLGAALLIVLAAASAGQDKSKKAYELIYEDVQLLKKQVLDLQSRLDRSAEDLRVLREQLKVLADLARQSAANQAGIKDDLKVVPSQYQDMLRKIDQVMVEIQKVAADLAAARSKEPVSTTGGDAAQGKPSKETSSARKPSEQKTAPVQPGAKAAAASSQPAGQTTAPPRAAPTISPQEAYTMAYNDYLKGNYDLAVKSFKLYREQFPDSPLADNALYWIGECRYSQRKFEEAIDAFNEVILTYPQGDKAAAAYLKKGLSYAELGKKDEAVAVFKLLVAKYPLQDEARIAQDKIKELVEK